MHPVITVLELGPRPLPLGSYGLMLALAIVVSSLLVLRAATRAGIDAGAVIAAIGCAIGGGFVGGWALQLLVQWVRAGSLQGALERPGLVFFGAAAGGVLALWLSARALGLPSARLLDHAVPAVAVGHALGRIGCLLGGCCYGAPTTLPWGVIYTHPLAPAAAGALTRHPVPLYEALALLMLALVFAQRPLPERPGARALAYVVAYSALRMLLELLRGDSVRGLLPGLGLSTSQLIAAALLLACGAQLWRLHASPRRAPSLV